MFIERHISSILKDLRESFLVVLLTGARQTGKTTLLRNDTGDISYFTLDDFLMLDSVNTDPMGFINKNTPPIIIDEIQYAPDLMRAIKIRVDRNGRYGDYFLIGSQQFHLMKNVSESLAGRMGILSLSGLSTREINGESFYEPFIPTYEYYEKRKETAATPDIEKMWERIWKGSMPELYANRNKGWKEFYSAYVRTYVERDVQALTQVGDQMAFVKFLTACAARTGQLLNLTNLANDVGVSDVTAKRWLSILEASDIIYLLQPFSMNITSRVVKSPKLYFMDTGLVSYLCKWLTPETLESGAMCGQVFETYVVTEIIKSYRNAGDEPPIYFYRDADKREIDVLIHANGTLYPIEVKMSSTPKSRDVKHFETLKKFTQLKVGPGAVICTHHMVLSMNGKDRSVPFTYI